MESPNGDSMLSVSLEENDDERERIMRRQSRLLGDQERNLNSPSTSSGRRIPVTALSGFSNEGLSQHYAECVRLSAENKITKKNAFQLHLIDYMADAIKKKDSNMNFQFASCALDASAKIYGYRVDALEAETRKLASNLGKTYKATQPEESQNSTGVENIVDLTQQRRKVKKSSKVERNLKNITLDKFEGQVDEKGPSFKTDPFRDQFASTYDNEGVAGLFAYNLPIIDDRCQFAMDHRMKPLSLYCVREFENDATINISAFKDIFRKICNEKPPIDLTFENFDFNQVESDSINYDNPCSTQSQQNHNLNDFVYNQEIQESEDDHSNHGSDPNEMDGADQDVPSAENPPLRLENVNDTIGLLSLKPSEYSYYDPNVVSAWAGPNRWRFLPFARRPGVELRRPQPRRRRPRRTPSLIDFDAEPMEIIHDASKHLLSEGTLSKWSREKQELPFDYHYNIEDIAKSMVNPNLWVRPMKKVAKTIEADDGGGYNYDNPADKANYCEGHAGENNNHDDDDDAASPVENNEMQFSLTQPQTDAQTEEVVPFTAENLVQQPYKIDKPIIAYAKTSTKIDAKKIKGAMWTVLSKSVLILVISEEENAEVMPEPMMFSHLYKEIPKHVSEVTVKNLSVPTAFVTFLHLCNEKNLQLTGQEDMGDFKIEQG